MAPFSPPWEEFDLRVQKSIDSYLADVPENYDIALHDIREHVCNDVNAEFQRNFQSQRNSQGDRRGVRLWPKIREDVIGRMKEMGYEKTAEGKYRLKHQN